MPGDAVIIGGVAVAGAAAAAWLLTRSPAAVAPVAPAVRPLASQAEGFRLQATGDGSVLRATRETVTSAEAMRNAALKACDDIPKGLFGARRAMCKKRVNNRYAKSMVRATRGITGGQGVEGAMKVITGLTDAAGNIISSYTGGGTNLAAMGTTTAPGGAQQVQK